MKAKPTLDKSKHVPARIEDRNNGAGSSFHSQINRKHEEKVVIGIEYLRTLEKQVSEAKR